jgi:MFS transporter, DHA1 family, inner membrane transport protein
VQTLRWIDPDPDVAKGALLVTFIRLSVVSLLRFTPPFLATMSDDLGVKLSTLAVGLAFAELVGLAAPIVGRQATKFGRVRWFRMASVIVVGGAAIFATSTTVVQIAIALAVINIGGNMIEVGMGDWIAHHVPYARRGRVNGISQYSWCGAFLVAVPIMAIGVVLVSWRAGVVIGLVGAVVIGVAIGRLPVASMPSPDHHQRHHIRWNANAVLVIASICAMAASTQHLFVTFATWLDDDHGFSTAEITAVTVGLGLIELLAATATVWLTDHFGKRRSTVFGAALMVPGGLLLAIGHGSVLVGLIGLYVLVCGFEFSIISTMPWVAELDPLARTEVIGWTSGATTLARAVSALSAGLLWDEFTMPGPAVAALVLAAVSVVAACAAKEPATMA